MFKVIIAALISSFFVSCGGSAPAPTRASARAYAVISEQADPEGSALTLIIKVPGPITQSSVKAIAESVIAERRAEYRHITVKSYAENMTTGDQPVAISTLEGDSVSHRFNLRSETEKIQTHL